MDIITAHRLVEEIAPRVEGARVTDVLAPGEDCLLLELSGGRSLFLGTVTMKALPILFVLDDSGRVPQERSEAPPFAGQLKGAEIVRMATLSDRPGALATLRWTSQVGRTVYRRLTVDLGRSPSVSLAEGGGSVIGATGAEAGEASGGQATAAPSGAPHEASPTVTTWHDDQGRLHARLSSVGRDAAADSAREFESLNDGAVHMFTEIWPELHLSRRREALRRAIERRFRRTRRAMEKVQAEIDDSENAERFRAMGQLLLSKQSEVRKGQQTVTLTDFDGATEVVIELDPRVGPQRNAESYFRRARKAERRLQRAPVRLGELEEKAAGYRAAADTLESAGPDELAALEERFLRKRPATNERKAPKERARFRTYHVSGGWEVLVGKSNKDNDVLTHQIASPNDLWFHARQAAGSHVVLRRAGKKAEPDRTAILEAAAIAAFHSKAGRSSKVSVCYTEKRHVRKARGGKPGLAIVAREKVVMVVPKLPDS